VRIYIVYTYLEGAMSTTIQRWGNSLAVRIPKAFALEAGLAEDSEVEIGVDDGKIVVRPVRKEWRLEELLDGVKPANLHGEIIWGGRAGREAW
jgi:antitoxin MazE